MAETLSQSEIDALLSALNTTLPDESDKVSVTKTGGTRDKTGATADRGSGAVTSRRRGKNAEQQEKIYDFKRQTKFSKEQLATIQMIHETFARYLGTDLSTQLRVYAQATIISVEQLTFEELIRSVYSPTFITAFRCETLDGKALVDINLNIVFTILDRLLGGNGTPLGTLRQLTEVEREIMKKQLARFLDRLREAWVNVIDLAPQIDLIESSPQFAQIVPPSDMVLSIVIEIKIHDVIGVMTLCLPYSTIEPIVHKLNAANWFAAIRKEPLQTNVDAISRQVKSVNLPFIVELGTTVISLQDVLGLQVGDIIMLDQQVRHNLNVRVGNLSKFRGRPGLLGKKMAVSITEVLDANEEALK